MSNLKPCPFCGGLNIRIYSDDPYPYNFKMPYKFSCETCGIYVYSGKEDKDQAIEKWNTRAEVKADE